jgi:hypothetical protein
MNIEKEYPDVPPGEKTFKSRVVKSVMFVLGRSMQNTVACDEQAAKEIEDLPEGYTIQFEVAPLGPYMALRKEKGGMKFLGLKKVDADLSMIFKNMEYAYLMLTARLSFPKVYCENGLAVIGDPAHSMILYRLSNIVQFYIWPKGIARRVLKRVPEMTMDKRVKRLKVYSRILF